MGLWSVATTIREVPELDIDLMSAVRDNDEAAFEQLYDRYHRRVQDFFYGLSRDSHAAADLCQETFFRIWRVRHRYAATGSFPSYLFTFARNIWLEHCRGLRKIRRLGIAESIEVHINSATTLRRNDPDELAGRAEVMSCVFDALNKLPEDQRMVFVLRNIEGLGLEEIASIMQCPVNTVRSRKLLAQRKIRESLQSQQVTPSHVL